MPQPIPADEARRAALLTLLRELADPVTRNAPTLAELARHGWPTTRIYRDFGGYPAACAAAGVDLVRTNRRVTRGEFLARYGAAVVTLGRPPTAAEFRRLTRHDAKVAGRMFGSWHAVQQAFRQFAGDDPQWSPALAVLDDPAVQSAARTALRQAQQAHRRAGAAGTLGDPLQFRALLHAPTAELGVVYLFGMLAGELGFLVEQFQPAFPDCTALRRVGPGRWERVRIELELESRNFAAHGHDPAGCDMLVCWRHNWPECPPELEVLELSATVQREKGG
jgi:hypothetical protein